MDTIASVDVRNPLVVFPHDTELDDTFGDLNDVQSSLIVWIGLEEGLQALSELVKSLFEFWLRWIDHNGSRERCGRGKEGKVVISEGRDREGILKDFLSFRLRLLLV